MVALLDGQREATFADKAGGVWMRREDGPIEHGLERRAHIAPVDAFQVLKKDEIKAMSAAFCVQSRREIRALVIPAILTNCQIHLDASSFAHGEGDSQEKSYCRRITGECHVLVTRARSRQLSSFYIGEIEKR
jgi:hypothetical protein